jgi:hypothetical protein
MNRLAGLIRFIKELWAQDEDMPPYPLTSDEWSFIQQREEAACQGREAAIEANSWVDSTGRLISIASGGDAEDHYKAA